MAAQNQEADALKSTIAASGRGGSRPEPPDKKKKAKDVQDTIAGKRLLKMLGLLISRKVVFLKLLCMRVYNI